MTMKGEICAPKRKRAVPVPARDCTRDEVREFARKGQMPIDKMPEVLP